MKKIITIVVALIVIALVVWFVAYRGPKPAEENANVLEEDSTSAIQEDLESLNSVDIDAELESIDADLNQL